MSHLTELAIRKGKQLTADGLKSLFDGSSLNLPHNAIGPLPVWQQGKMWCLNCNHRVNQVSSKSYLNVCACVRACVCACMWPQATSRWSHACLLKEHCISCRMLLHAQQLQAAVRVDWLFVKSTQLAAPAMVSYHVAILVPVGIDLCRKREWDLTHDHFPLKSIHCEGLSVYRRWREAESPMRNLGTWPCDHCSRICSSRIGLYTYQLTHWRQAQTVRRLWQCSPCVCVCVCVWHQLCWNCHKPLLKWSTLCLKKTS